MKRGCKTKFKKSYIKEIYEYKKEGYTDKSIYNNLWKISHDTFYSWRRLHVEFSEAYKKGVEDSKGTIAMLAKNSLISLITGYKSEEVESKEVKDEFGNIKSIQTRTVKRDVGPNVAAVLGTLYSLDPKNFVRNPEATSNGGVNIVGTLYTKIDESKGDKDDKDL